MIGRKIPLFKLFGIQVKLDASWLFIFVLVTWSLAAGFFPERCKGYNIAPVIFWFMGIIGAIGLFASILLHEITHSLVARRYGLPMKGITLFIFGGVAEMAEEPSRPEVEFRMAIAGPIFSFALSFLFFSIRYLGNSLVWPVEVLAVLYYLGWINSVLATFNLIPAFPLDGGRVLRSILWKRKQNLIEATRLASKSGAIFGAMLIGFGVICVLTGNFVGGMWYFLIGMFLRDAAAMSYSQVVLQKSLEGEHVKRFMNPNPVTVPSNLTLEEFVDKYLIRYHFKMFPVVDNAEFLGCISTRELKNVPRSEWHRHSVGDHMQPHSSHNTVSPDTDAKKALTLMSTQDNGRLMVVENGRLVGVITLKDILQYLSFILEFQEIERVAA